MAAVALGLVTLTGCEWFENAQKGVSQLLGGAEPIDDVVVPQPGPDDEIPAPLYGGPPSVDTGGPVPAPPAPPNPADSHPETPVMEDQPLHGVP
jgi:hypothetical protein